MLSIKDAGIVWLFSRGDLQVYIYSNIYAKRMRILLSYAKRYNSEGDTKRTVSHVKFSMKLLYFNKFII